MKYSTSYSNGKSELYYDAQGRMYNNLMTKLFDLIEKIHFDCYHLCKLAYGRYFENSGNMGVFCQSEEEYLALDEIKKELTQPSDNPNQKYFRLNTPFVISTKDDVPETTYEYLYIRKPDPTPYGKYLGDVDFIVEEYKLQKMLTEVKKDNVQGAEFYSYKNTYEMIQLTNKNINSVAYISTKEIAMGMRLKI